MRSVSVDLQSQSLGTGSLGFRTRVKAGMLRVCPCHVQAHQPHVCLQTPGSARRSCLTVSSRCAFANELPRPSGGKCLCLARASQEPLQFGCSLCERQRWGWLSGISFPACAHPAQHHVYLEPAQGGRGWWALSYRTAASVWGRTWCLMGFASPQDIGFHAGWLDSPLGPKRSPVCGISFSTAFSPGVGLHCSQPPRGP